MGIGVLRRHYAPGQAKKKGATPPPATIPEEPKLPPVNRLEAFLEGKTREEILELASLDDRKSAAPIYAEALEAG